MQGRRTVGGVRSAGGWRPAGAVALSASLWGLWLPLRALGGAGLSGPALNAALYGIASVVLLPWAWRRRDRIAAGGPLLLGAGALFGGALVSWNLALIQGEVVRVTLLFYLAPVWATCCSLLLRAGRAPARDLRRAWARRRRVLLGFADGLPLPRSLGDWLVRRPAYLFAVSVTLVRKGEAISGLSRPWCRSPRRLLSLLLLRSRRRPRRRRGGPRLGGARRARLAAAA